MFGKPINLFHLFGFQVRIDISWILLAILITWSLSVGYFPFQYKNLSPQYYWLLGAVGALGLFLSIVVHEVSHSLVARQYGIPMKGITLFIFGGVAEMSDEPPSAKAEFLMAVAGPISSFIIAGVFYWISSFETHSSWSEPVNGIVRYIAEINTLLGAFNLMPAFPLDGGRILRSILWKFKDNLRWATRISSWIGSAFGIVLIIMGALSAIRGNFIGGMWMFLIGMFLNAAAKASYQQLLTRKALEGEPIKRFMQTNLIVVPPDISIRQLVEDYMYHYHHKMFPVVQHNQLIGCITTKDVKKISRNEWDQKSVGQVLDICSPENIVVPQDDSLKVLSLMNRTGASRLMVVENGHLVGIITLKDMLDFLSLKIELEN